MIPCLKYENAASAIDWLCSTFGFEKKMVVEGAGGRIAHAELTYGRGMIMLGSVAEDEFSKLTTGPQKPGAVYITIDDCDTHYRSARDAGARIERSPSDREYGSREYICRDPEGYIWCFGTYDPWKE